MKNKSKRKYLIIVLSPVLLVMGIVTTLVLLPFYPFLHGWAAGDGNQLPAHPFLRFIRVTLTMYFKW